jgi:hypothetical protein
VTPDMRHQHAELCRSYHHPAGRLWSPQSSRRASFAQKAASYLLLESSASTPRFLRFVTDIAIGALTSKGGTQTDDKCHRVSSGQSRMSLRWLDRSYALNYMLVGPCLLFNGRTRLHGRW